MRIDNTIEWQEIEIEELGAFEVSDLEHIDFAVGNFINTIANNIRLTEPKPQEEYLSKFLVAPANEKLFLGEYDDPKLFLRKLMSNKSAREADTNNALKETREKINKRALPVLYFYREPTINPSDAVKFKNRFDVANFEHLSIDDYSVELTYHLFILSFENFSLSRLSNAFMAHFQLGQCAFQAKSKISDLSATFEVIVNDPKLISFASASIPRDAGKLHAAHAMFTVTAEQSRGRHVKATSKVGKAFMDGKVHG
ncbi:hypothetical protein [Pseudoalteromonas sp. Of7M-16]|uniref:hypothetical protein n=1 Tax=Pseudoalteromonas sp. Of7M-16 TaxID=2917756 RepID=UPI001EF52A16|nr:hypothetical protein [Pseudoalteromonas sp. Of7M-16]MCG7550956.1 hypothetical protein [Pseudoalteromonas sp. Of7M-16]